MINHDVKLAYQIHCNRDFVSLYRIILGNAVDVFYSLMGKYGYETRSNAQNGSITIGLNNVKETYFWNLEIIMYIQSCFKFFLLDSGLFPKRLNGDWYKYETFWLFLEKEERELLADNLFRSQFLRDRENEYHSMRNSENLCGLSLSKTKKPQSLFFK